MTDHEAMLAIQELLDGQIWTADVLEEIAAVLEPPPARPPRPSPASSAASTSRQARSPSWPAH
jgi:hypothetical protein